MLMMISRRGRYQRPVWLLLSIREGF